MGKRYYLFVYCITGKIVLKTDDLFKFDKDSIEELIDKLAQYKLFTKIHLMELDETFHKGLNELKIYSVLDKSNLKLKLSASKGVKEYIYYLSTLIAKKIHFDMCLENDIVTDIQRATIKKVTNECIENYCKYNIFNHNDIKFIYNPDKVNGVVTNLNVLKNSGECKEFWNI